MISVVIPVFNEEDNIHFLLKEITAVCKDVPISEVIFVDDGSLDSTCSLLTALKTQYAVLRSIRHDRQSGQSAALWTGIKAAGNDLIFTIDGDGQNDPADMRLLYEEFTRAEKNIPRLMVMGQRKRRKDTFTRRAASRFANTVRSMLLNDRTRDTGCSLKLFRRQDYINLPFFDHMHRFLPALMMRDQIEVIHIPVSHRPRRYGTSKYGNFGRLLCGITDLLGVWWLQRRPYGHPQITEDLY